MASEMMSGQRTYKWDVKVPEEFLREYDERTTQTTSELQVIIARLNRLEVDDAQTEARIDKIENRIEGELYRNDMAVQRFLTSRLVRFLNFFGCWYIYGKDPYEGTSVYAYANTPQNEKFGKAPLLTRAIRGLRRRILNFKQKRFRRKELKKLEREIDAYFLNDDYPPIELLDRYRTWVGKDFNPDTWKQTLREALRK